MKKYKPFEAAHLAFGEPADDAIAEGEAFDGAAAGYFSIYRDGDDFAVCRREKRDEELSRSDSLQDALDALGAWEVSVWRPADDELFAGVVEEDTWDPELLREAAEDDEDALAAIDAYEEKLY